MILLVIDSEETCLIWKIGAHMRPPILAHLNKYSPRVRGISWVAYVGFVTLFKKDSLRN